jgi:TctA family transporter
LAPVVIAFVTLAAYMGNYSLGDLAMVIVFGVLGVFMKAYGWPRPPILIAVVLGPIVEKYLWLTLNTYSWEVFVRPQFLIIFVSMAAVTLMSLRVQRGASEAMQQVKPSAKATVD